MPHTLEVVRMSGRTSRTKSSNKLKLALAYFFFFLALAACILHIPLLISASTKATDAISSLEDRFDFNLPTVFTPALHNASTTNIRTSINRNATGSSTTIPGIAAGNLHTASTLASAFNVTSIPDTDRTIRSSDLSNTGDSSTTSIIANTSENNGHDLPPLCLVHVGKTAGGTLTCRLMGSMRKKSRSTSECQFVHPLSTFVVGKLHKHQSEKYDGRSCKEHAEIFLVSLRDPVARIRSWFDYENPRLNRVNEVVGNRPYLYEDICKFNSIEQLSYSLKVALEGGGGGPQPSPPYQATNGTATTNNKSSWGEEGKNSTAMTCAKRAWLAITGKVGFQYHNLYNYEYYNKWIDSITMKRNVETGRTIKRQILVVRSEYLQEDWNSLEDFYHINTRQQQKEDEQQTNHNNGTSDFFQSVQLHGSASSIPKKNESSANSGVRREKRNPYQHFLCAALCQELCVYRQFLEDATNLSPFHKHQSLNHLDTITCPNMTMVAADCPTLHPTVQAHQDPKRKKYEDAKIPVGYRTKPGGGDSKLNKAAKQGKKQNWK